MHGGGPHVERIRVGGLRKKPLLDDRDSELLGCLGHFQEREPGEKLQPASGHLRVSLAGLFDDELRGDDLEIVSPTIPPVQRYLLVTRCDYISTWSRSEVADHGSLNVDPSFHWRMLTRPVGDPWGRPLGRTPAGFPQG